MASADKLTTTLSTKGQVILPAEIRRSRRWSAGVRLIVEDTPEGVLLRPAPTFKPTQVANVFGSLPYSGAPKSFADMKAGIKAEAERRHARGRY
jgi:AbrB family looped-hinge helix DNA binding protein